MEKRKISPHQARIIAIKAATGEDVSELFTGQGRGKAIREYVSSNIYRTSKWEIYSSTFVKYRGTETAIK